LSKIAQNKENEEDKSESKEINRDGKDGIINDKKKGKKIV
jgi:hypothetical protein